MGNRETQESRMINKLPPFAQIEKQISTGLEYFNHNI
jgi:hypothetical protein